MPSARVQALRMLARQRLTQSQLWIRLDRKGHTEDDIRAVVDRCCAEGLLDDRLFAQLYVADARKLLGDARLVMELARKGVAIDTARDAVRAAESDESTRCLKALAKLLRRDPVAAYPSLARALERLGFPAPLVYRVLREHAAQCGPLAALEMAEPA